MEEIFEKLKRRISGDKMHGVDHIERVIERAMDFDETTRADLDLLTLMIIVHGMKNPELILKEEGVDDWFISKVVDLLGEDPPRSIEAKIFHDAHFLEGDSQFFQIYKSLITSFERGQTLEDCVEFARGLRRRRAALSSNIDEFREREELYHQFFSDLSTLLK